MDGAVVGLAGGLHVFYCTYIFPGQFGPIIKAYAFMAVIAGGEAATPAFRSAPFR